MYVYDHKGINNAFVTSTLGASVAALAGVPLYSSYPLYKFSTSTGIC
jgi:hypothetical protein